MSAHIYDAALLRMVAEMDRLIIEAACDGDRFLGDHETQEIREMIMVTPQGQVIFP